MTQSFVSHFLTGPRSQILTTCLLILGELLQSSPGYPSKKEGNRKQTRHLLFLIPRLNFIWISFKLLSCYWNKRNDLNHWNCCFGSRVSIHFFARMMNDKRKFNKSVLAKNFSSVTGVLVQCWFDYLDLRSPHLQKSQVSVLDGLEDGLLAEVAQPRQPVTEECVHRLDLPAEPHLWVETGHGQTIPLADAGLLLPKQTSTR